MTVGQVSHFSVKYSQFLTKSYSFQQQYLVIDDVTALDYLFDLLDFVVES